MSNLIRIDPDNVPSRGNFHWSNETVHLKFDIPDRNETSWTWGPSPRKLFPLSLLHHPLLSFRITFFFYLRKAVERSLRRQRISTGLVTPRPFSVQPIWRGVIRYCPRGFWKFVAVAVSLELRGWIREMLLRGISFGEGLRDWI